MKRRKNCAHSPCLRFDAKRVLWLLTWPVLFHCFPLLMPTALLGQTLKATKAIEETKCGRFLGIFSKCVTIETERVHSTFTRDKLGVYLYNETWSTASHCTRVDPAEAKCRRSVMISSDPGWNRVLWGQSDNFVRAYGRAGNGTAQFSAPRGVDLTRREGEWHVAFIADSRNDRVVVIALGYTCKCVRWLGSLDGSESGTHLREPYDVAWDDAGTWEMTDDRAHIVDTGNDRVVVYEVSLDPVNGTMAKQYIAAFGSSGSGPDQFSSPKGIAVASGRLPICIPGGGCAYLPRAHVFISDTGNERVSWWVYPEDTSRALSDAIAGSELIGITQDYYGDIFVADRARDRIVKLSGSDLSLLKTYGGTSSWAAGDFNDPTDSHVIWHYELNQDQTITLEALPYIETTERWTPTTGGQLHQLGVDADELVASVPFVQGAREATFTFLFTGNGEYTISVKNSSGSVVKSWPTVVADGGRKSQYWDGKDSGGTLVPYGTYVVEVAHRSGYTNDSIPRTSSKSFELLSAFLVSASVPGYVNQKASYTNYGWATHPATDWEWYRSYSDYPTWTFLSSQQNVTWTAFAGQYTIYWHLLARRIADSMTDDIYTQTEVCIGSGCVPAMVAAGVVAAGGESTPQLSPDQTAAGGDIAQDITPERRGDHYGSGAWVGWTGSDGPQVFQLYSLAGNHDSAHPEWPNALESSSPVIQRSSPQADDQSEANAAFTRIARTASDRSYRVLFEKARSKVASVYVGLALDPDLGVHPEDDLLGVDSATGLIWVADPDSGALGYVLTGIPEGARVRVRQFSSGKETWRPDPVTDSEAYAELTSETSAVTGRRDDVRLVVSIGPVQLGAGDVQLAVSLTRAASLADLRASAAQLAGAAVASVSEDDERTGITEFRLTQAPPDPMVPPGVARVSLSLVPGLTSRSEKQLPPAESAELRAAVRKYGITALAFAVPDGETARIRIRVYDSAGRLVRTLIDESYDEGAYRVQWDLRDERGAHVAPGVYLAIMDAPGFRDMTKLVVVP